MILIRSFHPQRHIALANKALLLKSSDEDELGSNSDHSSSSTQQKRRRVEGEDDTDISRQSSQSPDVPSDFWGRVDIWFADAIDLHGLNLSQADGTWKQ
jgi:DNA-nicking Smr family endonuclease